MAKKVFRLTLRQSATKLVHERSVIAENEGEARRIAVERARVTYGGGNFDVVACQIIGDNLS
jgi:hypothetical protein